MDIAESRTYPGVLSPLTRNSDIFMAVSVVAILLVMIIPLPPLLMDILLSFNITFSLIILLVGMYILKPLELSAFPSILLLATLFRLSLNVASTRLILLHGNEGTAAAGKVIDAFGSFVVGGNYLVGIIVFLILIVINFMVITKGAGRIAEVAARFTLDAMPGKQMSIDADLNAGLIDEEEAKNRRMEIAREAEYYGAMDGANKFVRGDAIAGIIITLINIVAGLTVGVLQNKMSFGDAAQTYTLLTIGDGLVSQIPALIISSAAGIIVSRAGSDTSMGKEITVQLLSYPRAMGVAAAVLLGFGLVPGFPSVPFISLAIIISLLGYTIYKSQQKQQRVAEELEPQPTEAEPLESVEALPPLDILALEVGYGLVPLVDIEQNGELLDRIKSIRHQMAQEIGLIVPSIHIQDNMQLKPGEYSILLKGNEIARGELMLNCLLAMNPAGAVIDIEGIATQEPTYGLPAAWIQEAEKEKAIAQGYTVVDLATVLTTHLAEIIRRNASELLGRQETQRLLDTVKETHPKVVDELVPSLLSLGGIVKVLQNLLHEQIPVRDLLTILETLADWAPTTKDTDALTEKVRQALARTITHLYQSVEGNIALITLEHDVEQILAEAIQSADGGTYLALDPSIAQKIVDNLAQKIEVFTQINSHPIVLCSAPIRLHLKKLISRFIPELTVLSYNDLISSVQIQSIGTVGLSNAN